MTPPDHAVVRRRIALGEGQITEFKGTTGQLKPATKTLAAFASQQEGGWVIFGVNDDSTVNRDFTIGADTQEKIAQTIRANTLSMTTAQPLLPRLYALREPDLLVAVIPPALTGTALTSPTASVGAGQARRPTRSTSTTDSSPASTKTRWWTRTRTTRCRTGSAGGAEVNSSTVEAQPTGLTTASTTQSAAPTAAGETGQSDLRRPARAQLKTYTVQRRSGLPS